MVDEQTFIGEVQAMERTLYRVARSYLPGWESCADAVQEALTKAWAKRSRAKPEFFRAWMTRIVINECHNISRHRKRVLPAADIRPPADPPPDYAPLHDSLTALPEKLRTPLLLHYLEGFPLADVARILRVPEGTVKSRLYLARKKLKLRLEEEDDNP
jgi:RNA polymerase sigma-70 factor, ECF subfamily